MKFRSSWMVTKKSLVCIYASLIKLGGGIGYGKVVALEHYTMKSIAAREGTRGSRGTSVRLVNGRKVTLIQDNRSSHCFPERNHTLSDEIA